MLQAVRWAAAAEASLSLLTRLWQHIVQLVEWNGAIEQQLWGWVALNIAEMAKLGVELLSLEEVEDVIRLQVQVLLDQDPILVVVFVVELHGWVEIQGGAILEETVIPMS